MSRPSGERAEGSLSENWRRGPYKICTRVYNGLLSVLLSFNVHHKAFVPAITSGWKVSPTGFTYLAPPCHLVLN